MVPNDLIAVDRTYYGRDSIFHTGEQARVEQIFWDTEEFVETQYINKQDTLNQKTTFRFRFVRVNLVFPMRKEGQGRTARVRALLTNIDHNYKPELTTIEEKALAQHAFRTNPIYQKTRNQFDDPYLSSMRIRYGHALTVHKAQGGEWNKVVMRLAFPGKAKSDYWWVYTALTRAQKTCVYQCF